MGLSSFLGIKKFGQGIATATRNLTGGLDEDIELQNQQMAQQSKILYAAKQEKDPVKRKKLLTMANTTLGPTPQEIDPGLNLTNREVLGSAANVGLNILTPGAFKGGKAAILAKNAALGTGYGVASGLNENRSAGGVVGSAVGGALLGTAIGGAGLVLKAVRNFTTKTTPNWLMNNAVKPSLDELRKNVKYGTKTLGAELLGEGVKGGPQKLLHIADDKLASLEDELQKVLSSPSLSEVRITRKQIAPYLDDILKIKGSTPGVGGDVQRIKNVLDSVPEQITLPEANKIKRQIYAELRSVAYKLDAKLGAKGVAMKSIAHGLKKEIEKSVGGTLVNDINRKLSIYGRLEDRIVDQLAREMRNNGIGLTDAIIASGGLATGNPLAFLGSLGFTIAKDSAALKTYAAQGLNKVGNALDSGAVQGVKEIGRRGLFNIR